MQRIGDLLGEVLANTAKLVAERKALIREGSCAPGHGFAGEDGTNSAMQKICGTDTLAGMTYPPCGAPVTAGGVLSETRGPQSPSGDPATGEKVAGGNGGPGFKSPANAYTTDHTAPAGRGTSPKSTAGGKRGWMLKPCSCSVGVHDVRTAKMQAMTGAAISEAAAQK